jgi:GDPmannose 4,6-dehydratase
MRALITGITGQDGHYLKSLLLEKDYEVWGLIRNTNTTMDDVEVIYGDVTDPPPLPAVDEIYNLAAMSHVGESFRCPAHTFNVNTVGAVKMMAHAMKVGAKFYQASTSEIFGNAPPPQHMHSPRNPVSPYGVAKLAAHKQVSVMRSQGFYACSGILFNHESPRRGDNFVTQKICKAARRIARGEQDRLVLGPLHTQRDWGHAEDYVRGMWQIMQQESPANYILATGVSHSVRDWAELAFSLVGLDYSQWISQDDAFYRPNDVNHLCGESNANFWKPEITFEKLVEEMVHEAG